MEAGEGRLGGREAEKGGSEGKGRRVDFRDLKHISIHGEEEATDSRETEGLRAAYHKHAVHVSEQLTTWGGCGRPILSNILHINVHTNPPWR